MQYRNIAATTITNRTTDIMMKKFLMLYAFLMTALSLFAREDRVSNFEQLMRLPRIAETDMVSYPGRQVYDVSSLSQEIKTSIILPFR